MDFCGLNWQRYLKSKIGAERIDYSSDAEFRMAQQMELDQEEERQWRKCEEDQAYDEYIEFLIEKEMQYRAQFGDELVDSMIKDFGDSWMEEMERNEKQRSNEHGQKSEIVF